MIDRILLEVYFQGFADALDDKFDNSKKNIKAYNLGASHAFIGDDVRSVDYLSDEEILKMIYDVKHV